MPEHRRTMLIAELETQQVKAHMWSIKLAAVQEEEQRLTGLLGIAQARIDTLTEELVGARTHQ